MPGSDCTIAPPCPSVNPRPKILLIHGFGGGVHEVQPLADYLVGQGFSVACPILTGHAPLGGKVNRRILSRARWQDWVEDAARELHQWNGGQESSDVVVIGFSMGGLVGFQLAASQSAASQSANSIISSPRIQSIITINTPIFYWNLVQVVKNLSDDLLHHRLDHTRRYLRAKGNSPIPAMLEFLKLLHNTKQQLPQVRCPALILQAKDDDTVRLSSVDYLLSHLGSAEKSARFMEHGGHLILHSQQAQEVMRIITGEISTK